MNQIVIKYNKIKIFYEIQFFIFNCNNDRLSTICSIQCSFNFNTAVLFLVHNLLSNIHNSTIVIKRKCLLSVKKNKKSTMTQLKLFLRAIM